MFERKFSFSTHGQLARAINHGFDNDDLGLLTSHFSKVSTKSWVLAEELIEESQKKGVWILSFLDAAFPAELKNIPNPPLVVFLRAKAKDILIRPSIAELKSPAKYCPSIAVVGSRACSPYGREQARELGKVIVSRGCRLVSGLAWGIDQHALEAGVNFLRRNKGESNRVESNSAESNSAGPKPGAIIAVIGSGVCRIYPAHNDRLAAAIVEEGGCILSEYGLYEGPQKHHFPQRNRLISALADQVVVVEACLRSGALITARTALEQGKDVLAIPGRIDSPESAGTNRLIKQGAFLYSEPDDLLSGVRCAAEVLQPAAEEASASAGISGEESSLPRRILALLDRVGAMSSESISTNLAQPISSILEIVALLQIEGKIFRHSSGLFSTQEF